MATEPLSGTPRGALAPVHWTADESAVLDSISRVCARKYQRSLRGQDLDDIVHDLFVHFATPSAGKRPRQLEDETGFRKWAYTVAINFLITQVRRLDNKGAEPKAGMVSLDTGAASGSNDEAPQPQIPSTVMSPMDRLECSETAKRIRAAVVGLPQKQREAFFDHHFLYCLYSDRDHDPRFERTSHKANLHLAMKRLMDEFGGLLET